jgi:anti-anti-sigma regulatory factor
MLRITVKETRKALTFQLEGTLAGIWVREIEECWSSTMTRERKPIVRVDLTGVTFIDTPGKACLATMHRQGAEFIARDCMTKDVVREICEDHSRTVAPKSST